MSNWENIFKPVSDGYKDFLAASSQFSITNSIHNLNLLYVMEKKSPDFEYIIDTNEYNKLNGEKLAI